MYYMMKMERPAVRHKTILNKFDLVQNGGVYCFKISSVHKTFRMADEVQKTDPFGNS